MNKKDWIILVGVVVVVAVLASLMTANFTGNVVSSYDARLVTVSEGKTASFNVDGNDYKLKVLSIFRDEVKFALTYKVNGEVISQSLREGEAISITPIRSLYLRHTYYSSKDRVVNKATFSIQYVEQSAWLTKQDVLDMLNNASYFERFAGSCDSFCGSINQTCFTAGFRYVLSGNPYEDNAYTLINCKLTIEQLRTLLNMNRTLDSRLLCGCA